MRVSDKSYPDLVLYGAPSRRQRMARRRLLVISAIIGLTLGSWVLGALSMRSAPPASGQASHFTSE